MTGEHTAAKERQSNSGPTANSSKTERERERVGNRQSDSGRRANSSKRERE